MKLVKIPDDRYYKYRLQAMFDCYKWDPQFCDSNTLAKYVLILTKEENDAVIKLTKNLDKETIYRLCEDMDHTLAYFFERLLTLGLFDKTDSTGYYAYITKPQYNMYLDKDKYYELQEKIKDVKFNGYLDKHILSLQDCFDNEVFTAMIFSNITSYMEEHQFDHFERLFKKLEKNLDSNGSMQIGNGFINNSFKVTGGDPIDRNFIKRFKDNIEEIQTKKEIITYYHK